MSEPWILIIKKYSTKKAAGLSYSGPLPLVTQGTIPLGPGLRGPHPQTYPSHPIKGFMMKI